MNSCICCVLFAAVILSASALTPEECQPMVTTMSLSDHSVLYGRHNCISGYTDSEVFNNILKVTESSWMKISAAPDSTDHVVMHEENKMNGACLVSKANMTIDGDTIRVSVANISSEFNLLSSSEGCVILSGNTIAKQMDKFLRLLNMDTNIMEEELHARFAYLMCKDEQIMDSKLEHFKQQAGCLGFSGEPNFLYDHSKGFCVEGEGALMTF